MNMTIEFTKASGAGNDFVIVDNMDGRIRTDKPRLAAVLCSRHFGIGADGLLLVEPSATANFRMLYFNADGSTGGMCGNGGRCVARYAFLRGIAPAQQSFEALGFVYHADVQGAAVRLRMKDPEGFRPPFPLETPRENVTASFVDTGAPHAVVFDTSLEERDVPGTGRLLAHHVAFGEAGTNVNFVQLLGDDRIAMRTYERGVEDETLACGTGSVACAIVASMQFGLRSPVHVQTRSGEDLHVEFSNQDGLLNHVVLVGSAHMLFSGTVSYDDRKGRITDPIIEPSPTTSRP